MYISLWLSSLLMMNKPSRDTTELPEAIVGNAQLIWLTNSRDASRIHHDNHICL